MRTYVQATLNHTCEIQIFKIYGRSILLILRRTGYKSRLCCVYQRVEETKSDHVKNGLQAETGTWQLILERR